MSLQDQEYKSLRDEIISRTRTCNDLVKFAYTLCVTLWGASLTFVKEISSPVLWPLLFSMPVIIAISSYYLICTNMQQIALEEHYIKKKFENIKSNDIDWESINTPPYDKKSLIHNNRKSIFSLMNVLIAGAIIAEISIIGLTGIYFEPSAEEYSTYGFTEDDDPPVYALGKPDVEKIVKSEKFFNYCLVVVGIIDLSALIIWIKYWPSRFLKFIYSEDQQENLKSPNKKLDYSKKPTSLVYDVELTINNKTTHHSVTCNCQDNKPIYLPILNNGSNTPKNRLKIIENTMVFLSKMEVPYYAVKKDTNTYMTPHDEKILSTWEFHQSEYECELRSGTHKGFVILYNLTCNIPNQHSISFKLIDCF